MADYSPEAMRSRLAELEQQRGELAREIAIVRRALGLGPMSAREAVTRWPGLSPQDVADCSGLSAKAFYAAAKRGQITFEGGVMLPEARDSYDE